MLRYALIFLVIAITAACVTGSPAQTPAAAKPATPVDVNSADLKTLETLPGVGPATAKRIVEGRPYQTLSDLGKVKGLSESKLTALKSLVVFGPAAAPQTPGPKTKPAAASTTTGPGGTPTATQVSKPSTATPKLAPGQKLNINTASAEELDKLPGIGPSKANAIVNYRNQNGNFKTIEEIQKVKGIKEGLFAKIKDHIKVSD